MEYFFKPFAHFHPIKGKVPELLSDDFEYIAARARKILKKRKIKEIHFAMKTVNWIMEMADRDMDDLANIQTISNKKKTYKQKELSILENYYSPASMLLNSIGKYDITGQNGFSLDRSFDY